VRILADEDVPYPSIRSIRERGHDVDAVVDDAPGTEDTDVLARAVRDNRVLVTRDRDFGELIFREGQAAPPGLIYVRDNGEDPLAVGGWYWT